MSNGYTPIEPEGNSPAMDWAKKVHRAAFTSRRMLTSPGALTSQTTQGTFSKPRPHVKANGGGGDLPVWL